MHFSNRRCHPSSCFFAVLAMLFAVGRLFLLPKTCQMFSRLQLLYQNNTNLSPGHLGCRITLYYLDIANVFQIWSKLASLRNSRHFAIPLLVSPRNGVWETSAEISSILMTPDYPDLDSASDFVEANFQPIRRTIQIWLVSRHHYRISTLVSQTSFRGKTSRGIAKCGLFSQAKHYLVMNEI